MRHRYLLVWAACASIALPSIALANARLISVTPTDGGCVSGPTGPAVQAWDVEPGKTYELTISNVSECATGGTDATLNVRVMSSNVGNTDVVATFVSPGVYKFSFTLPLNAVCTFPIKYCTTSGDGSSGIFVHRNDGGAFQAHLRAASFGPVCSNPTPIVGGDCLVTPTRPSTWARVKSFYR